MPVDRRELLRKSLHTAVGLLAFLIAPLGPIYSGLGALALVAWNVLVLPRVARLLWREGEIERGAGAGIVLYPVMVLALVVLFHRRLEIAAAAWAILAFGDGMAGIAGTLWGRHKLPWNPDKSWAGSLAYWIFGALAATVLLVWTLSYQGNEAPLIFLAAAATLAALFAAVLESQPQDLDDNLTVPLPASLVLLGLLQSQEFWTGGPHSELLSAFAAGAAINLVLAVAAFAARAVDLSGAAAGIVLGTTITTFLGGRGFLLLAAFLILASGATRLGYAQKTTLGVAQERGGRRRAGNAFANAGVATLAAVFAATTPHPAIYLAAFAAACATATGDTLSSEVGQLWGRTTVLVTSGQPVPAGTDGGISLVGSAAGLAGALAISLLGWSVGFYGAEGIAAVTAAAVLGIFADSLLGATLEARGQLDNEGVNFAATAAGAMIAAGLTAAW